MTESDNETEAPLSSWPEATKLFVYFDETTFDDGRAFGYGGLLTDQPIEASVIEAALACLRSDLDFDDQYDQRTLDRGWFHASEDSRNAHSHLRTQIGSSIHGQFIHTLTRHSDAAPQGRLKDSKQYDSMLLNSFIRVLPRARQVDVLIEQRSGLTSDRVPRSRRSPEPRTPRTAAAEPNNAN